tara:strand:+ start:3086 stop:3952 length:867 start_codon:yes stop_codon:yes gene_type:complete
MSYIKLIRPKQWFKNSFVLAPLVFSGQINLELLIISIQALMVFITSSSCVYIFNDIRDINYDKQHPKKRLRPIASGDIAVNNAILYLLFLFSLNIFLMFYFGISMSGVVLISSYLLLNVLYSLGLKNIPLLELAILSSGFVIRLVFGAEVTSIPLSPWIIVCSGLLSLMIAVGKRRSDLYQQSYNQTESRASLKGYNLEFLDQVNSLLASLTIMSYLLFSTSEYAFSLLGNSVIWTAPFVIFSILRYLQLVSVNNEGEDPTSMLLGDKITIALFSIWFCLMVSIIYLN